MQNRRVDFYLTDNQDHTNGNESVDDLTKKLAEYFSEYKLYGGSDEQTTF